MFANGSKNSLLLKEILYHIKYKVLVFKLHSKLNNNITLVLKIFIDISGLK